MAAFVSWHDYYDFAEGVKKRYRYVLDDTGHAFVRALLDTSKKRIKVIPAGSKFWRACLDHGTEGELGVIVPCKRERLTPFRDKAPEGASEPNGYSLSVCD